MVKFKMATNSRKTLFQRVLSPVLLIPVLSLVVGCGMPSQFEVRSGIEPEYQDEDVRFRSTYYFRVYDYCNNPASPSERRIMTDSLYRFRMTGKTDALFSKIHFESGFLDKSQIDPFGSTVKYNEKTGSFYYVSQQETQQSVKEAAKREAEEREVNRILAEIKQLDKLKNKDDDIKNLRKRLTDRLDAIFASRNAPSPIDGPTGSGGSNSSSKGSAGCPAGTQLQRGFQVLGPEGYRTFDQDERLLLAMSSSGKPLINALRQLSNRILTEQVVPEKELLPLFQELLTVSQAQRKIQESLRSGKTAAQIVEAAQKEFSKSAGGTSLRSLGTEQPGTPSREAIMNELARSTSGSGN